MAFEIAHRIGHLPSQMLGQKQRFGMIGAGAENDDLSSTKTEQPIRGTQDGGELAGHGFQNLIAFEMAKAIIHLLEIVRVDNEQRNHLAAFLTFANKRWPLDLHLAAVEDTGQRVAAAAQD